MWDPHAASHWSVSLSIPGETSIILPFPRMGSGHHKRVSDAPSCSNYRGFRSQLDTRDRAKSGAYQPQSRWQHARAYDSWLLVHPTRTERQLLPRRQKTFHEEILNIYVSHPEASFRSCGDTYQHTWGILALRRSICRVGYGVARFERAFGTLSDVVPDLCGGGRIRHGPVLRLTPRG